MSRLLLPPLVLLLVLCVNHAEAADWPQWLGPQRDGVWRTDGLVETLPESGLVRAWSVPCGLGYAGPAVADGKVYLFEYDKAEGAVTDNPGARDRLQGTERLRCLDARTGDELWRYEYEREYFVSYPSGPRCTPTVDGDRVYALGAEGDLSCLKTADGSLVWKKHFATDYGAPTPMWGHAAHPLVVGDTLYCLVGGEGSVAVAFDKNTGEEKWRALSAPTINNEVGYCPPSLIEWNGHRNLIVFYPEAVAALAPETGTVLWSVPIQSAYGMSIAQPNLLGDRLFTSAYGGSSVLLELPEAPGAEPTVLWSGAPKTSVSTANVTPVPGAAGEVLYGIEANTSRLCAIDLKTGKRFWQTQRPTLNTEERSRERHGTSFITRQGETDRFWLAAENGDLILARLTSAGYEEIGRQPLIEPTGSTFGRSVWWSHPAYAERSVFARNDKELVRVSLAAE